MGKRMVMRHGLRQRRRRSRTKYMNVQIPLIVGVMCSLVAVSYTVGWGSGSSSAAVLPAAAARRLGATCEGNLQKDPFTNNETNFCGFDDSAVPSAGNPGQFGTFCAGCKLKGCKEEEVTEYKNQKRSSISKMSNYVVNVNLDQTFEELKANLNGSNSEKYLSDLKVDWTDNKDDLVQYFYRTTDDPSATNVRTSGADGRQLYGMWFGPSGTKASNSCGGPSPENAGLNGGECIEPPKKYRVCTTAESKARNTTDPTICEKWVKHDLDTTRASIRMCELPEVAGAYPPNIFTYDQKLNGAIIFHIVIIVYMFIGIAIVCDEFFEPALAEICESLDLKDDVAGATFMAAGGSAPELFTSIMGVFVAENDIGFGTIVGSAVFNVLFVIAMCAFVCPGLKLTFWPLVRDSSYYCFSILVLVAFIIDEKVEIHESAILFSLYLCYVIMMKFNADLEKWVTKQLRFVAWEKNKPVWRTNIKTFIDSTTVSTFIYFCIIANILIVFIEPTENPNPGGQNPYQVINLFFCAVFVVEFFFKILGYRFFGYWTDPMNCFDGILVIMIGVELSLASYHGSAKSGSGGLRALRTLRFFKVMRGLRIVRLWRLVKTKSMDASTQWVEGDWNKEFAKKSMSFRSGIKEDDNATASASVAPDDSSGLTSPSHSSNKKQGDEEAPLVENAEEEDEDEDEPFSPFDFGDEPSIMDYIVVGSSMPIRLAMYFTIPDCRRPQLKKLFPITFFMCIVWIAIYSYFMVWMAVQLGCVCSIPDPVMGLTLLAAGTSIPDALSSLAVAKKGHGDMAVSSSIGSNIFDILFGLAVPWMLGSAVTGSCLTPIKIRSSSMSIMVLTLFIMVAVMIMCIVFSGWKLTRRLGFTYMVLYVLFVAESLLLEYGILFPAE